MGGNKGQYELSFGNKVEALLLEIGRLCATGYL